MLFEARKPWLLYTSQRNWVPQLPTGFCELRLDSGKIRNLDDFYQEASLVFKLPDYFGNNLDAFDECLNDLSWLPGQGYLVIFENAELFLCDESDSVVNGILSIFHGAGWEWAKSVSVGEWRDSKAKPFHTVLELSEDGGTSWLQKVNRKEIVICKLELESDLLI